MEADFGFGRQGWRFKEWAEFLVDVTQGAVVQEQGFINLRQPPPAVNPLQGALPEAQQ